MTDFHSPVRCLAVIVDRGKGEQVTRLCRTRQVSVRLVLLGHGTASAEIMDYLGLDEPEKELVLCLVPDGLVPALLSELSAELGFSRPGRGIAFTLPLSGVSAAANCPPDHGAARVALSVEREGSPMAEANHFELIVCVAEHGMSGDVMDAARAVGATGGTVLRARGLGGEEAERFLNITIQPEKEVVLILSAAAQKQAIMKAVCAEVFSRTGERGIAFSLPVSDVTGLNLARLSEPAE